MSAPKTSSSMSVGDRKSPLEANLDLDISREGEEIGKLVEVSPVAGGELLPLRGKEAKILGVVRRFGEVVGYDLGLEGKSIIATPKDVFVERCVLEDVQIPTATSLSVQSALQHWLTPRTYWSTRIDGLESYFFALASVTKKAIWPPVKESLTSGGWAAQVPTPMLPQVVRVEGRFFLHDEYWTLTTAVFPEDASGNWRTPLEEVFQSEGSLIEDHWERVYIWSRGWTYLPHWHEAYREQKVRWENTQKLLRPAFKKVLAEVCSAVGEETGKLPSFPPGSYSIAFSTIRLKPGTVGLVEPPTDRRPYAVISINPSAMKSEEYFRQVLLHEAMHLAIQSPGGDPHGKLFHRVADRVGLEPKHRD
jgi:hypothetical protein